MNPAVHLSVIGSGPSGIYLLKHLLDAVGTMRGHLASVTVVETAGEAGYGMPYHPDMTDVFNLSNIAPEEIPPLVEPLIDWLRTRTDAELATWRMQRESLQASGIYPRLAVGAWLKDQFEQLVRALTAQGIPSQVRTGLEVEDVRKEADGKLTLVLTDGEELAFDRVVIATGHQWPEEDNVAHGHFLSPWPIRKLLPAPGTYINTAVGILGASLSAFDVVSSLAHRHGDFVRNGKGLRYEPRAGSDGFALVLHSSEGWLPHLQFDQVEPRREIYRHMDRAGLLALVDAQGFLRLETYFDQVCRPALRQAFVKDDMEELVELLSDESFGIVQFTTRMTDLHSYCDAFEGMKTELVESRESVLQHRPIHWKETIDDLMYGLNYHGELLPAEDHLIFRKVVMPFLMNVIAAMPLPSAHILLALHDAGILTLKKGRVTVDDNQPVPGRTRVTLEDENESTQAEYGMFVNCGGQKPLEVADYPFPSLVRQGIVSAATARYADSAAAADTPEDLQAGSPDKPVMLIGGVGINAAYQVLRQDGTPDSSVCDLAFPHTSGTRPYSYGLQACSATSSILVSTWVESVQNAAPVAGRLEEVSGLSEEVSRT